MRSSLIYLDNNATTKVAPELIESMMPFLEDQYANPSSPHAMGAKALAALDEAREKIAGFLGADPAEIVFTSGGTESNNAAIQGVLLAQPQKRHLIISSVEHHSVLRFCEMLEKQGCELTRLPVDKQGCLDPRDLEQAIRPETALVSIMAANNETSVIFPIETLSRITREHGVVFHTDAVQAAGKIPIKLKESAINLLSVSAHKLHAPKGVGLLYVRKGTPWKPMIVGGHQERDRRGGTENMAGIVGFAKACELAEQGMAEENSRVKRLRDYLEQELLKRIPDSVVHGQGRDRLTNTSLMSFADTDSETLILALSDRGICVSSGSACVSGLMLPSHVLKAMGVPENLARGTLRFSLSRYTTQSEIEQTIAAVTELIEQVRFIAEAS